MFFSVHGGFVDPVIARFDREVQFYLAYADYIEPLKAAELAFCYPEASTRCGETAVQGGFDLALPARPPRGLARSFQTTSSSTGGADPRRDGAESGR